MEVTTDVSKIRQAENASKTAESLTVNLLLTMFSEEELKKGNCTTPRREDITLLDQNRVSAIRGTVYMHEKYAHMKQIFFIQSTSISNSLCRRHWRVNGGAVF